MLTKLFFLNKSFRRAVRPQFVLATATAIGYNKSRDLSRAIAVAVCKNKLRSNFSKAFLQKLE